jgi:pilus assembly protein Flp/PilA
MQKIFTCFVFDTSGATAIEYALIAAGIALAIVTAITNLGGNLGNQYNSIANVVS